MSQYVNSNLENQVLLEDIPESYQPVASLIGVKSFIDLCKYVNGDEIYFPMLKYITKKARNRNLIKEYNGSNESELARKYLLSKKQIGNIILQALEEK